MDQLALGAGHEEAPKATASKLKAPKAVEQVGQASSTTAAKATEPPADQVKEEPQSPASTLTAPNAVEQVGQASHQPEQQATEESTVVAKATEPPAVRREKQKPQSPASKLTAKQAIEKLVPEKFRAYLRKNLHNRHSLKKLTFYFYLKRETLRPTPQTPAGLEASAPTPVKCHAMQKGADPPASFPLRAPPTPVSSVDPPPKKKQEADTPADATKQSKPQQCKPKQIEVPSGWRSKCTVEQLAQLDDKWGWDRSMDDTHFTIEMPEPHAPLKVHDLVSWC